MNYPHITFEAAIQLPVEQKFIFYWMPKCAGTSMRNAFLQTYRQKFLECNNGHPSVFDPTVKCVTFYHSHVPALIENGYVPEDWVRQAFGFAVVRNTWDRLVSLHAYLHRTALASTIPKDFESFIKAVVDGNYSKPDARSQTGYYQANSVLDWLRPDGRWLPQFIGKFENLQYDWSILSKIMGISCPLAKRNVSPHSHYSQYYTEETRRLVRDYFSEEIEIFDFSFELEVSK